MLKKFQFIKTVLASVFFFSLLTNSFAEEVAENIQSYIEKRDRAMDRWDFSTAIQESQKAIELAPGNIEVRSDLAGIYSIGRDYDLAREEFKGICGLKVQKQGYRRRLFYLVGLILILLFSLLVKVSEKYIDWKKYFYEFSFFKAKDRWIILLLLIVPLIISRIPPLASAADFLPTIYLGSIARDLIEGLRTNIFNYQYAGYNGGILLISFIAVPFLLLFGDTFFSFSLIPFLFTIMTLILIYGFLSKYFGRDSAIITSFLFVFLAPFFFVQRTMQALGDHVEMVFFILIALSMFYSIFFNRSLNLTYYSIQESPRLKRRLYLLCGIFGIICGLALYACYGFFIALVTLFLFWYIFDKKLFLRRYFYIFLFTFLIGFSPWFGYHVTHDWEMTSPVPEEPVVDRPSQNQEDSSASSASSPILSLPVVPLTLVSPAPILPQDNDGSLISRLLPLLNMVKIDKFMNKFTTFNLELKQMFFSSPADFIPVDTFYNIILFAFIGILLLNLRRIGKIFLKLCSFRAVKEERPLIYKETIILVFVILYIIAYCLHPMEWPKTHYILPVLPFLFMLVGIFVGKIYRIRRLFPIGPVAGTFAIIFLISAAFSNYQDITHYKGKSNCFLHSIFKVKAYSLVDLGKWRSYPNSLYMVDYYDSDNVALFCNLFRNPWLRIRFSSCRYDIDKEYALIEGERPELRYPIYLILGVNIGDGMGNLPDTALNVAIEQSISPKYRHCTYEGIALSFTNRFFKDLMRVFKSGVIAQNVPPEYQHYFYTEFGRRIGEKYKSGIEKGIKIIEGLDERYRPYLYRGFIGSFGEDLTREIFEDRIDIIEKRYRRDFYTQWGALICQRYKAGMPNNKELNTFIENLPDKDKSFFIQGLAGEFYNLSSNNLRSDSLQKRLKEGACLFSAALSENYYPSIYEGLGYGLSLKTYGHLKEYGIYIKGIVPAGYIDSFYRGYGRGISLRYGEAKGEIERIISEQIQQRWQSACYEGIES